MFLGGTFCVSLLGLFGLCYLVVVYTWIINAWHLAQLSVCLDNWLTEEEKYILTAGETIQ